MNSLFFVMLKLLSSSSQIVENYMSSAAHQSAVDWKSAKQSTIAMSSTEAEYIATTEAAMEAFWMRKFISGLGVIPINERPMDMYCDNTGAIIIANEPGVQKDARHYRRKLHYISKHTIMLKMLERYQNCTYSSMEVNRSANDAEQSSYKEYMKLKAKYESLQQYQRQLFGEDLGPLSLKELEQLERQLDSTLRQIRSIRTQSMLDRLSDLQVKERMWLEANKTLQNKLEEFYAENQAGPSWAGGENGNSFGQHQEQHTQHDQAFFQPLDCNSNLQIGYNTLGSNQITASTSGQNVNGIVPGWML